MKDCISKIVVYVNSWCHKQRSNDTEDDWMFIYVSILTIDWQTSTIDEKKRLAIIVHKHMEDTGSVSDDPFQVKMIYHTELMDEC